MCLFVCLFFFFLAVFYDSALIYILWPAQAYELSLKKVDLK